MQPPPPELWEGGMKQQGGLLQETDTANTLKTLLLGENMKGVEEWGEERLPFLCTPVSSSL